MKEPKYTRWIEQYLEGELSLEDMAQFETELAINPELREEYDLFKAVEEHFRLEADMEEMLNDPDLEKVMKITETWFDDTESQQPTAQQPTAQQPTAKFKLRPKHWFRIAASIAALIALTFYIVNRPPSPDKLFKYYYAELGSENMVDEDMPADVYNGLLKGMEQFEADDYTNAISTFEALDPFKEQYPQISLFKGLVRLKIGKYTEALEDFEECAKHESKWLKYAQKFRGICYLRLGNPKVAAFYLLEKTGLSENLDPGSQSLINSINLITTGQWRAFRQKVNPGASGPIVLSTVDIVLGIIVILILILNIYCVVDIWRRKARWQVKLKLSRKVLFNPGIGAVIYILKRRKEKQEDLLKRK